MKVKDMEKKKKEKQKSQESTFPLGIERRTSHPLHQELVLVLNRVLLLRVSKDRPKPLLLVIENPRSKPKSNPEQIRERE